MCETIKFSASLLHRAVSLWTDKFENDKETLRLPISQIVRTQFVKDCNVATLYARMFRYRIHSKL